jgi:hypothetical protein
MLKSRVSEGLRLSRFLDEEREAVFLVEGTEAIALCEREGFCKVAPSRAIGLFDNMDRLGCSQVRGFASRTKLAPLPLQAMNDRQVFTVVRDHIRTGRLVGVRQDGKGNSQAQGGGLAQRRLIREIESLVRGRLSLAGRSYKLVADVDLAKMPRRDDYEVVSHDQAVDVLARLAGQPGAGGLAELLGKASKLLTRDWRPPASEPDGLILLRHVPVLAAASIEAPAITPSQMAKLADEQPATLEVVVLGFDDKPLKGIAYVIEAPDAETYEGDLGASAKTKITSAKKGSAGVTLKWSDTGAST